MVVTVNTIKIHQAASSTSRLCRVPAGTNKRHHALKSNLNHHQSNTIKCQQATANTMKQYETPSNIINSGDIQCFERVFRRKVLSQMRAMWRKEPFAIRCILVCWVASVIFCPSLCTSPMLESHGTTLKVKTCQNAATAASLQGGPDLEAPKACRKLSSFCFMVQH